MSKSESKEWYPKASKSRIEMALPVSRANPSTNRSIAEDLKHIFKSYNKVFSKLKLQTRVVTFRITLRAWGWRPSVKLAKFNASVAESKYPPLQISLEAIANSICNRDHLISLLSEIAAFLSRWHLIFN